MAVGTETASAESLSSELPQRQHRTLWGDVWLRFRRHNLANIGVVVLVLLVIGVLAGPLIYTVDPEYSFIVDDIDSINQTPSLKYPLGTDDLGRDTLARNLFGGRISLAVGVVAMFVSITFGTLVGVLSGFFRRLDNPLMRFTDLMLALPSLPLLLVIIMLFRDSLKAFLGPELGIFPARGARYRHSGLDADGPGRAGIGVVYQGERVRRGCGQRWDARACDPVAAHPAQRSEPNYCVGNAGGGCGDTDRVGAFFPGSGFSFQRAYVGAAALREQRFHHPESVARHLARHVHLAHDSQH